MASNVFSAIGVGSAFSVEHGASIDYATVLDGEGSTYDCTLKLQRSNNGFGSAENVLSVTAASSGRYVCEHPGRTSYSYRWCCTAFGESGDPVLATLTEYDQPSVDVDGGNQTVEGNQVVEGTLAVTGAVSFGAGVTITGAITSNVLKLILGGANTFLASCATANIPTGAGYAKGCLLVATDGTDHTNTLFVNIGDATTANFNAVTIAADA